MLTDKARRILECAKNDINEVIDNYITERISLNKRLRQVEDNITKLTEEVNELTKTLE